MSPTIRIDDDVYERLKAHAEPFVDTPNTVLRRLLDLDPSQDPPQDPVADSVESVQPTLPTRPTLPKVPPAGASSSSRKRQPKKATTRRHRAPAGSLLPEERYEIPLLTAIVELGGSGPSREIIELVGTRLKDDLTEVDKEKLASGGIRWHSRVQFVRLRLIERGLMVKEAPRGVWAISEVGRQLVQEYESGAA